MMNRILEINSICVEKLIGAFGELICRGALPGKFKVFESLQPAVAHSGHGASISGNATCSQVSLECHRNGHTSKHSN